MSKQMPAPSRTEALQRHKDLVASFGCMVCKMPAQLHHAKSGSMVELIGLTGAAMRNSDWLVIPLCMNHHTGTEGIHTVGVETWEFKYGTQTGMLIEMEKRTGTDIWAMAIEPVPPHPLRKSRCTRSKKTLPVRFQ